MSYNIFNTFNTNELDQLCARKFGSYKIINTVSIPITLNSKPPFFSGCANQKGMPELLVTPVAVEFTFGAGDSMPVQTVPISSNTLINIKDYVTNSTQNGYGVANIRLTGEWDYYKFIIGTQLITQIDKSTNTCSYETDIGAIPYCNIQNYYLEIHVSGNATLTFDNIKFNEPIYFSNSNINNPASYYVKKIITWKPYSNNNGSTELVKRVNYLRFMSDCAGLAY